MCGRGGIGRRAALRSLFFNRSGSSSLLGRTITLVQLIDYPQFYIPAGILLFHTFGALFVVLAHITTTAEFPHML